jgi:hypothetical protein
MILALLFFILVAPEALRRGILAMLGRPVDR